MTKIGYDFMYVMVTVGAIATAASINAEIAAFNLGNPEPISKVVIWSGNALVALGCIAIRAILKEAREEDQRRLIDTLKYEKALHICMQEGYINPRNLGLAVETLSKE